MKNFKKLMALVIAAVMVVGTVNMALADDPAPAQGARTLDETVEITGLDKGDVVKLYQVMDWEDSAGWRVLAPFTAVDGLLTTNLDANPQQTVTIDTGTVNAIAAQVANASANLKDTQTVGDTKKYSKSGLAAGLYVAIVQPAEDGTMYNPIILSVDWDETPSNSIDANTSTIPASSGAGATAVAKKSSIPLDKTSTGSATNDGSDKVTGDAAGQGKDSATVKVGDTVSFTVTSKIPVFSKSYTDPYYAITDKMSAGLKLVANSVQLTKPAGAVKGTDYTITENTDGYTVDFISNDYLWNLGAITDVEITYSATVTTDAVSSVNHETNTVTLEYSNNPNDANSHGKIKDGTNHYTFDIDGNILGQNNREANEVVKVGVDKDGNEITETVKLMNENWVGALEGAKFKLVYDNNGAAGTTSVPKYKIENGVAIEDGVWEDIESDGKGRISITGLDAGTYWLVETDAPDGYIKMQEAVKVEIKTWFKKVTMTEDGVDFEVEVLDKYTIEIGGVETASYTITNSCDKTKTTSSIGDTVVGTDATSGKLKNTQGVELPSTGGMGTTLFYAIGAVLVLGAGILLVTKRRMSAN